MVKAANVKLIGKVHVGGGLVTVMVRGMSARKGGYGCRSSCSAADWRTDIRTVSFQGRTYDVELILPKMDEGK
jgi:ethanolamine utilization protein EutM